jgi:hypothetical protein
MPACLIAGGMCHICHYFLLSMIHIDCQYRNHFNCTDLVEHFKSLATQNKLLEFEELQSTALMLHCTFSSTRAHYWALHDTAGMSDWAKCVHVGSPWTPPSIDPTSLSASQAQTKNKLTKKTQNPKGSEVGAPPFKGDRALANSIALMRDAMISHDMSYAIVEGDMGRVYEVMKVTISRCTDLPPF